MFQTANEVSSAQVENVLVVGGMKRVANVGSILIGLSGVAACSSPSRDFGVGSAGNGGDNVAAGASSGPIGGSGGSAPGGVANSHAGAGAGSTEGGAAGMGGFSGAASLAGMGGSAASDTTPPKVDSISPAKGATGIKADAKVVVTFSEPVERASAEAALTLGTAAFTFTWNEQSTVMTATPVTPFEYATGQTATSYTLQISTGLKDLAGNHSLAAFSSSFKTLRRISLKIKRPVTGTYTVSSFPSANASSGDSSPLIGDGFENDYYRAIPDFDISSLPATLTSIESATMSIPISIKNPINNNDWGSALTDLGNLVVDHISDSPIKESTLTKPALSRVGTLMTSAVITSGTKTIEVTSALADDFANRAARSNRSQYRLQFTKTTDNDASLDLFAIPFSGEMSIDVVYLIP